MPGGNKTGPDERGPMTGRRMGYCVNNEHPGSYYSNSNSAGGFGRGRAGSRGFGRGEGRGLQHRFGLGFRFGRRNISEPFIENVSEKTLIENDIRVLREQLSGLEDRLGKLNEE